MPGRDQGQAGGNSEQQGWVEGAPDHGKELE